MDLRDENTLILALLAHVHPGAFGDGEYMGRVLVAPLSAVLMDNRVGVQR